MATELPAQITAGTTVKYTSTPSSYPANLGWVLKLYLAGAKVQNYTGTPNGASFDFTLSSTSTAMLTAGLYQWKEVASKSGEQYVYTSGSVEVLPDITAAGAGDLQDHDEKMLQMINAVLENRITADVESYMIDRRQVVKIPIKELRAMKTEIEQKIAMKETPGKFGVPVRMVFTGPASEGE